MAATEQQMRTFQSLLTLCTLLLPRHLRLQSGMRPIQWCLIGCTFGTGNVYSIGVTRAVGSAQSGAHASMRVICASAKTSCSSIHGFVAGIPETHTRPFKAERSRFFGCASGAAAFPGWRRRSNKEISARQYGHLARVGWGYGSSLAIIRPRHDWQNRWPHPVVSSDTTGNSTQHTGHRSVLIFSTSAATPSRPFRSSVSPRGLGALCRSAERGLVGAAIDV